MFLLMLGVSLCGGGGILVYPHPGHGGGQRLGNERGFFLRRGGVILIIHTILTYKLAVLSCIFGIYRQFT